MAENKKSFILYVDQKTTVDMLSDEQAGRLLKHIYAYVNDENPILESLELKLVFEPIKQQFKRDLKKWENTKEQKSVAGIMGNLKRYNSDLYEAVQSNAMQLSEAQTIAESRRISQRDTELAVNVNVNDNVNDNVNVTVNETVIDTDTRFSFRKSLCEYGANEKLVDDWLKVRKTKKAANTETAFNGFISQVEKSNKHIDEVLRTCIENSWKGFNSEWLEKEKSSEKKESSAWDKFTELTNQIKQAQ